MSISRFPGSSPACSECEHTWPDKADGRHPAKAAAAPSNGAKEGCPCGREKHPALREAETICVK